VAGSRARLESRTATVVAAQAMPATSASKSPQSMAARSPFGCPRPKKAMTMPPKASATPSHCSVASRSAGSFQCRPRATKIGAV